MSNFESISNLDIDEKFKERLKSVWYFPEYHPIAFLYDLFFFRMSLNFILDAILKNDKKIPESNLLNKVFNANELASFSFFGTMAVLVIWGAGGLLLFSPLLLFFPALLNSPVSFIFILVGIFAADRIGNGRLEVLRAIRNANKRSIH